MKRVHLLLVLSLTGISLMCGSDIELLLEEGKGFNEFIFFVISTTPSAGEGSVPVSSEISVLVNDYPDTDTLPPISPDNFIVRTGGIPVSGSTAFNPVTKTITFTPDTVLSPGTAYTFFLSRNIASIAGVELTADYSFGFTTAAASEPEFELYRGATPVHNGDTYDFGTITVGDPPRDIVFTINNTGTGPLNLMGVPYVQAAGVGFSIFDQPDHPVPAGGSTTFTVRFTSPTAGTKTAVITVPNNDSTENPYTFTVIGTIVASGAVPEINVKQGSTHYPSGTEYKFGTVYVGDSSVPVPFTIENLGNGNLTVSSIVLGGAAPGEFLLGGLPAFPASILPGTSIGFTVRFIPTEKGKPAAEVQIQNDDSNENPYILKLEGKAKDH